MFSNLVALLLLVRLANTLRVDNLSVSGKEAQSITLEWSLPATIDPEWIAYKIKYSTDNLIYTPILLKNINVKKFRLDNLKPNTEYKIQISAVNKNDLEGPATDFVLARTLDAGLSRSMNIAFD
ncbi:hypothetical protein BpHYR1_036308 [Brachionus plicatilis]|uniref:Fibronectin type-III domain-containing protein n=1 Tax=Brachionus plicatilis TaxID=10195 RepID=A0A3M7SLI1_BRAPC|nr:hypothetical protein BpHYR1_036308 [Brachionus plicatilis]